MQHITSLLLLVVFQVKIFEEDFRKERSDRERMNEEKEDLRRQVERLQGQMTNLTNQVSYVLIYSAAVSSTVDITLTSDIDHTHRNFN